MPEAVVGVGVFHNDRQAGDFIAAAEAVGEEVAQRGLHARAIAAIPIDAQKHILVGGRALRSPVLFLWSKEGEPEMSDHAGTLDVHDRMRLSRSNAKIVIVAVLLQVAGRRNLAAVAAVGAAPER